MTKSTSDDRLDHGEPRLDEETDPLSLLSYSLSLTLQIASTSIYRLSSSSHVALHPGVATHIHSNATLPSKAAEGHTSERSASGLVPPSQLREDVQELVDDFMNQVQAMRAQIDTLLPEQPLSDHETELQRLQQEVQDSNAIYADALSRAQALQAQVSEAIELGCW
ncbi:unnamed protein product [Jaminaea pallidilutea]